MHASSTHDGRTAIESEREEGNNTMNVGKHHTETLFYELT